jgi:SAM-dependent methyltransferase
MKLAHKVRKIFDRELVSSAREHFHRALHPVSARRLHSELEQNKAWDDLRRRYPRGEKEVHRFADTRFWVRRNVERAQDLRLDRPPPRRILDLGCGPGYFLYVAKRLGHEGIGVDIDEQPMFRETLRLLEVDRIVHRIKVRQPLPPNENKFDLITSYLTCFHRLERKADGNWRTWSTGDWQFFIDDVRANQLNREGTLLLEFHPQKNGELYSDEVRQLFRKNGARLFRSKLFIGTQA